MNQKIIALMNHKGGVAKTTSAVYLARAAVLRGFKARVVDTDTQLNAYNWISQAAADGDDTGIAAAAATADTLPAVLQQDCEDGMWTFVDTAPTFGREHMTAAHMADLVVVPVGDSPLDFQQTWSLVKSLPGKPVKALLSDAEKRTVALRETAEGLKEQNIPMFDSVVHKRQDIKTCFKSCPKKLWEYADVFGEIVEFFKTAETN